MFWPKVWWSWRSKLFVTAGPEVIACATGWSLEMGLRRDGRWALTPLQVITKVDNPKIGSLRYVMCCSIWKNVLGLELLHSSDLRFKPWLRICLVSVSFTIQWEDTRIQQNATHTKLGIRNNKTIGVPTTKVGEPTDYRSKLPPIVFLLQNLSTFAW